MSRVAKKPVTLPKGVDAKIDGEVLVIKGPKGSLEQIVPSVVEVAIENSEIRFSANDDEHVKLAGTLRALANNMIIGVSQGFERKLQLVGVGYRAQAQGAMLNLALGYSHPINYPVPAGISIETPSQTEIVVKGLDKQKVGQVASEIRGFRPPEPYKGKGVKYSDETILRKEAKKK